MTHVTGAGIAAALLCLAVLPVRSETPAATLGKQRAASSPLQWEVRDAGHPILGEIRFAVIKGSWETPVGNAKVYSRAYLSCQKVGRKLAIELANATSPDDPGGLKANADPRLVCNRAAAADKVVREELLASWEFNELGDAMAKGFRAFPLRECASISVVQEVALPKGWAQKSARVEFDIAPYNREVDAVFVACGEKSAYGPTAPPPKLAAASPPAAGPAPAKATAPAATAPAKAAPPIAPTPAPAIPPVPAKPAIAASGTIKPAAPAPAAATVPAKPAPAEAAWQSARTTPNGGKTNVRSTPGLTGAIVITLDPGAVVQVQKTATDWWKAKSSGAAAFEGYIRQDRLVFK